MANEQLGCWMFREIRIKGSMIRSVMLMRASSTLVGNERPVMVLRHTHRQGFEIMFIARNCSTAARLGFEPDDMPWLTFDHNNDQKELHYPGDDTSFILDMRRNANLYVYFTLLPAGPQQLAVFSMDGFKQASAPFLKAVDMDRKKPAH